MFVGVKKIGNPTDRSVKSWKRTNTCSENKHSLVSRDYHSVADEVLIIGEITHYSLFHGSLLAWDY